MSPPADAIRSRRMTPVLVPWAVYVGVTLVGPAANGAWRNPGFAEHAGITLVVSGAIAAAWGFSAHRGRRDRDSRLQS